MRLALYEVYGQTALTKRGWIMTAMLNSAGDAVDYAVRCGWKKVYAWQRDDTHNDAWSDDYKPLADRDERRHK